MESKRILIVEDEETLALVLQESLVDEGFQVEVARDGEQALEVFKGKPCDLVVTDLRMPKMSGLDLLREIRGLSPTTEVIIVTAYGSMEVAVEALRLRAFDFVMKPYTVEGLKECIKRALRRAQSGLPDTMINPEKYVFNSQDDSTGLHVSCDVSAHDAITCFLDLYPVGDNTHLVYFERGDELLGLGLDILPEIKGFLRKGLLSGDPIPRLRESLTGYLEESHGVQGGWRLLVGTHDPAIQKMVLGWEGSQQHLVYSRRTGVAENLLSSSKLKRLRRGSTEYQMTFSGGDSLIFLPSRMLEYVNNGLGLMEFMSIVESCFRSNGGSPAGKIRKAVVDSHSEDTPGVIVVSAKELVDFSNRLRVSIPADRRNLGEMKCVSEQVCSQSGCTDEETFEVVTAVNEALLNSIIHGYCGGDGKVQVEFTRKGKRLKVEVHDKGRGFAQRSLIDEIVNAKGMPRHVDARGMSLIRSLMDEVNVSSTPGKGTTIKMEKSISGDAK